MKTKSIFMAMLAVVIGLTAVATDAAVRKGPYLIYEGVNTEMTVLWQLDNSQTCTIEWGETLSYGSSDTTTEYGGDQQYTYTIAGLTPGVKYYYQVVGVGSGSFTAAPANDATDVKFLAYGDTRSYPADHDAVCAEMITTYTSDPAYQTMTLHVADYVNDGDSENDWTIQFFDPAQTNSNAFQADMALNGCKGNHEGTGNLFYKYFPYPYLSAFYWSFDYGPVHIAVVDQYPWSSTQRDWLENDLAGSTKEWKILVFHEPGWSAGGGHSNRIDVQTDIQPLCLAYGVDFVFGGHNHYYARCDVDGVQHITTGGGGAPLRTPEMDYPNLVIAESVHHFCEIDIQGGELNFVARRESGSVIDTCAIVRTDMQVTPNSTATFSGTEGGPFSPASHVYTVSNIGDVPIDWTVDYVETWLQCTPVSGTLAADQQVDVTVSLTSIADTLPFGAYFDTLAFTDTTNSEFMLRDVELRVGGNGTGLNGDYYDNMDLTGFVLARIDPTVNFDWGSGSPDPSMGADTFSVRWTGQVQPLYSETYTFKTTSDDGVRLWVDGQQIIDNWTDHGPTDDTGNIALSAGVQYDITLEYYENGGGAVMKLYWSSASQSEEIIPQMQLYPPADDTDPPTPNPATFASPPAADSSSAISMTATTGSDATNPVEYYFDETSGNPGGTDSGWQTSASYTDSGLSASTQYTYTVQMRDAATPTPNVGTASSPANATTDDPPLVLPWTEGFESGDFVTGGWTTTGAPSVADPAAYSGLYGAKIPGGSSIEVGIDTTGFTGIHVKYRRETKALDAGEELIVDWYDGSTWTPLEAIEDCLYSDGLQDKICGAGADNNASFKIRFRNTADKTNETAYIDDIEVTDLGTPPDTDPPTPNPATFAVAPTADGSYAISMTATTGSDASGPVEYYFDETSGNPGGSDSGWQTSPSYTDTGLSPSTQYTYTVQMRDSAPTPNVGTASSPASATTDAGCTPTDIHIEAVVCDELGGCGPASSNGQATVTIYDDCGNPVVNALVDGTFSGDFDETFYDVLTDANGQALFTTAGCVKKPAFSFTVIDVDHATLPYDSNDDLTTGCSG